MQAFSTFQSSRVCITNPERNLGSNQVVLGGIILPLSAISMSCFIETGYRARARPIYAALQTLLRYKELGGIEVIHDMNKQKAALLYEEIDTNPLFKGTVTCKEDRSLMNVCFVMSEGYEHLEDEFDKYASEAGMVGIKGHRSVGGFRASIYNAMPIASVQALVDTMRSFAQLKTQK
jgi:phosphoserine aminotransferase